MFPNLLTIGHFQLHTYGLMLALGFVFAITLSMSRAKKAGENPGFISDLAVWSILGGLLGGRLFYVFLNFEDYRGNLLSIFNPVQPDGTIGIGGLVFLGALISGTIATIGYILYRGKSVLETGDIVVPGVAFAYAIGRMGCFFSGCCFGKACHLPWGLSFPPDSPAGYYQHMIHADMLHPTQLYMVIGALLTGAILLLLERYKRFNGHVFFMYFILAGTDRIIQDFFRFYPKAELHHGYTHNQWVLSAAVLVTTIIFIVKWRRAKPR